MLGERISNGINLQRLGARLTLAAVLSDRVHRRCGNTPFVGAGAQEPASPNQADKARGVPTPIFRAMWPMPCRTPKSLQGQHITAATVEGDVTVSGYVRDDASKELAETVIYKVKGVRSVTNNLTVGDAPQANTANAQAQIRIRRRSKT